jgi:hypothetical protein
MSLRHRAAGCCGLVRRVSFHERGTLQDRFDKSSVFLLVSLRGFGIEALMFYAARKSGIAVT